MTIAPVIIAFLLGGILSLVLLYFFLLLVRACLRIFVPRDARGTLTGRAVVISLGVTAVLFSDTANLLVQGPIGLVLEAFRAFVGGLEQALVEFESGDVSRSLPALLVQELSGPIPAIASDAQSLLQRFSIPSLAAGFAVFFVLANALSGGAGGSRDQALLLRVRSWYANLTAPARARLLLSAAVLFGAYLSFAAVLSVPWLGGLDEQDPQEGSRLRARLVAATSSAKEWEAQWSAELVSQDLLAPLDTFLAESGEARRAQQEYVEGPPAPEGETAEQKSEREALVLERQESLAQVRRDFAEIDRMMRTMEQQWIELRESAELGRSERLEEALQTYERYRDKNLSDRERQIFRDDLTRWYSWAARTIDEELRNYRADVQWRTRRWRRWALDTVSALRNGEVWYSSPGIPTEDEFRQPLRKIGPPPTPRDVTGIGIFGFFAQWLIETRSYSVALLCGMIGFGLIGSAVARALLPVKAETEAEKVASRGTADVVLVGVSASLIIFLAALGGLAIFAGGESQPNAYMLFLASLVGAAYGDRVWATARKRFLESLENQGGKAGGGEGGQGADEGGGA